MKLFRVQDLEGRGPYRPGRQIAWCDDDHTERHWETAREVLGHVDQDALQRGERAGHGFRDLEQTRRWFTATERQRLAGLDYQLVLIDFDRILIETPNQVLFTRRRPLRFGVEVLSWRTV